MSESGLQLSDEDVRQALPSLDPLELVAGELTGARASAVRRAKVVDRYTVFEDTETGTSFQLSTATLQMIRTAALTALAVRALQTPSVVTAAIIGSATAVRVQLEMLTRWVPNISHVAACALREGLEPPIEPRLREVSDRAGHELTVTDAPARAAFGANVVVVAGDAGGLAGWRPNPGLLLVQAADDELPGTLLDAFDQVYVDDLRLLDDNRHRKVVRAHLADPPAGTEQLRSYEGWHRHHDHWRTQRRIETDLRRVLSTEAPGRVDGDDILLVELLGTREVGTALAAGLRRAALDMGLGTQEPNR